MLSLRPIIKADLPFLQDLYGSTRETELLQTGWTDDQKQHFIAMQFELQHQHYQKHYPNGDFDLVLYQSVPIGRFYIEAWSEEIRIIDIALLPQYCNQGLGSYLLKRTLKKATTLKKSVSFHVEQHNPAMQLYQRLGFMKTGTHGIYHLMKWQPA